MVVGVVMLLAALGWGLFVGWDIRAGNMFMQVLLAADVVIALFLMIWGFQKKKRQIN